MPFMLLDVVADAFHALRQMRRRLGFTTIVVAALGLGIGASVALVSVVDSLMLRPLPIRDEARVRVFWQDYSWTDEEYDFLRERVQVFDKLAVFSTEGATYSPTTRTGEPATVLPFVVSSPSLFDALAIRPMLGRVYDLNDDRRGAAPVVVISYGMWQQDFGGDPRVIGRRVMLDGIATTVIGVMPRGFFFPNPDQRAWRPLQLDPTSDEYKAGYLTVVARTGAGATDAQVGGEMRRLARALAARFTYPAAWDHGRNPSAIPVHTYVLGDIREPLLLLLSAVALLFLIACANAAALILARSIDRSGEMRVRAALGAAGWRLARHVLVESFVLALCAAIVGSILASAGFRTLVARLPLAGGLDTVTNIGVPTLLAAFALALIVTAAVSVLPVRHLLLGALGDARGERSAEGLQRGARRAHGAIIGAQVAFAILLVVGAMLLIRSVGKINAIDPGFDARGVTTFSVFAGSGVEPSARREAYRDLARRVGALPGVRDVGLTNRLPVRDLGYQSGVGIEGHPDLVGARKPTALYRTATPGYFQTMGMRMLEGRGFDSTDVDGAMPVAVVNEAFAKQMWPGQRAIGKHVAESWSGTKVSRTVVGVMREAKLTGFTANPPLALWVPFDQTGSAPVGAVLTVKSAAPAATTIPAVRRAIGEGEPPLAIARVQTMDDAIATALAAPLRLRFFFTVFAALALALGSIGVFGVVSYAVARRRAEFAVRMALGASPQLVRRHVLEFGLTPVAMGIAIGSLAALGAMRSVRGFLFGIAPTDPASFVVAGASLLAVGAIAALWPAIRAGRTSPAEALREM